MFAKINSIEKLLLFIPTALLDVYVHPVLVRGCNYISVALTAVVATTVTTDTCGVSLMQQSYEMTSRCQHTRLHLHPASGTMWETALSQRNANTGRTVVGNITYQSEDFKPELG